MQSVLYSSPVAMRPSTTARGCPGESITKAREDRLRRVSAACPMSVPEAGLATTHRTRYSRTTLTIKSSPHSRYVFLGLKYVVPD
jgi:hypothetical protein